MRKLLITLTIIGSLVLMGCPKKDKARQAASASYQLSGLVLDLANATERALDAKAITPETAQFASTWLRRMNEGAVKLTALAKELEASKGNPPMGKLELFNKIFSTEIVTPFLNVLQRIGALDANQSAYFGTAINALRIAVLTIAGTLSENGFDVNTGGLNAA